MEVLPRKQARALGLKRYFTGIVCKNGHVAERCVESKKCVVCYSEKRAKKYRETPGLIAAKAEYNRNYRAINRERLKKSEKESRERRKESIRERNRAWRENNKEYIAIKNAQYRQENAEKLSAYNSKYRADNALAIAEYVREWRKRFPEKAKAIHSAKRARRLAAEGKFTASDVARIRQQQKDKCAYCKRKLSDLVEHIDHIIPLARGGSNWPNNIQLLCSECNQKKKAKDPLAYAKSLGLLL